MKAQIPVQPDVIFKEQSDPVTGLIPQLSRLRRIPQTPGVRQQCKDRTAAGACAATFMRLGLCFPDCCTPGLSQLIGEPPYCTERRL